MTIDEFFQGIPVPVFLLNEDRQVEKMTPAAAAIFSGLSESAGGDECTFGRVVNCIHCLYDPRGCGHTPYCGDCPVRTTILDIYATGQPCRQKEVKLTLSPDGHDCHLVISAELLALPSGRKILLHFEDITARKKAEEKLALTKDILDRAQKVARVGSWHMDLLTNTMLWTDEAYRLFGLEPGTPVNYDRFLQKVHPGTGSMSRRNGGRHWPENPMKSSTGSSSRAGQMGPGKSRSGDRQERQAAAGPSVRCRISPAINSRRRIKPASQRELLHVSRVTLWVDSPPPWPMRWASRHGDHGQRPGYQRLLAPDARAKSRTSRKSGRSLPMWSKTANGRLRSSGRSGYI